MSDAIDERKAAYPGRPWLWNAEWAQGRVLPFEKPGTMTGSIRGYWVVAILILSTFHLIPRVVPAEEPFWPAKATVWGLALLLATCGFVALYLAVKRTRSWRRFGEVWLALETNPAILGGTLRAAIRAARGFPEDARASVRLACNRHSHTGSHLTGWLWQETRTPPVRDGSIPVEFDLPVDMPESDPDMPAGGWCTWDLAVEVTCPAASFTGQFTVPVFESDTVAGA